MQLVHMALRTKTCFGGGEAGEGELLTGRDDVCDGEVRDDIQCAAHNRLVLVSQQLLDCPPRQLYGLQCKACRSGDIESAAMTSRPP